MPPMLVSYPCKQTAPATLASRLAHHPQKQATHITYASTLPTQHKLAQISYHFKKKVFSCFNFSTSFTHGLTQSLNLWRKLCLFKWLNFSRSLISNVQQLLGHALKITIFALMWKIALILIWIAWYINVWSFKVVPFCKHKKEKKSSWSLLLVVKNKLYRSM